MISEAHITEAPIFSKSETKIILGLERVKRVLSYFGDPQSKFESCVVTGTVGKGQIATNIAYNLSKFGKIALYTSPHLERFSERMKIVDGERECEISSEEVVELSKMVFEAERILGEDLTFFEHATVMAFLWFAEKKVDFASLEVGMGGRLDAVATAEAKIGVIGRIHYDHTDFLGDTLYKIAFEKALCVPPESLRITLHKEGEEQFNAIRAVSKGKIIHDFKIKELGSTSHEDTIFVKKRFQIYETEHLPDEPIHVDFFGPETFTENAVLSSFTSYLVILNLFGKKHDGFVFDIRRVKGRMEKVGNFIYDGGHNPISAEFLCRTLPKMKFIVAFMRDKNWREFLRILKPKIDHLYVTKTESERSCNPEDIVEFARNLKIPSEIVPLEQIPERFAGERDPVCFTGTFYLYKAFRKTISLSKTA